MRMHFFVLKRIRIIFEFLEPEKSLAAAKASQKLLSEALKAECKKTYQQQSASIFFIRFLHIK